MFDNGSLLRRRKRFKTGKSEDEQIDSGLANSGGENFNESFSDNIQAYEDLTEDEHQNQNANQNNQVPSNDSNDIDSIPSYNHSFGANPSLFINYEHLTKITKEQSIKTSLPNSNPIFNQQINPLNHMFMMNNNFKPSSLIIDTENYTKTVDELNVNVSPSFSSASSRSTASAYESDLDEPKAKIQKIEPKKPSSFSIDSLIGEKKPKNKLKTLNPNSLSIKKPKNYKKEFNLDKDLLLKEANELNNQNGLQMTPKTSNKKGNMSNLSATTPSSSGADSTSSRCESPEENNSNVYSKLKQQNRQLSQNVSYLPNNPMFNLLNNSNLTQFSSNDLRLRNSLSLIYSNNPGLVGLESNTTSSINNQALFKPNETTQQNFYKFFNEAILMRAAAAAAAANNNERQLNLQNYLTINNNLVSSSPISNHQPITNQNGQLFINQQSDLQNQSFSNILPLFLPMHT